MNSVSTMNDFLAFLSASPSSYHAAHEVARRLETVGFTRLEEQDSWLGVLVPGAKWYVIRDGAIVAWSMPKTVEASTALRILGSHTDSPGFKVKPGPVTESHGFSQLNVEVYGGPILDTWFDRELEFAGRIVSRDGREHLVRSGPVARIPQLAIHLDRSANDTRAVDRQLHTQPILGVGSLDFFGELAASVGLTSGDIAGHDIISVDAQPAALFGQDQQLIASGRLDNLTSVYASCQAFVEFDHDSSDTISVLAAFDHEELGSESRSGASGPLLAEVLERISESLGASRDQQAQAFATSWCVSADAAHSINPNFAGKHDPNVYPVLGGGPVLKLNANQRYATDAHGSAFWRAACERANVATQEFVSNNSIPCGTTIGPLTATRLGIRTLDVGVPILSMHSARELCHRGDIAQFVAVLKACLS